MNIVQNPTQPTQTELDLIEMSNQTAQVLENLRATTVNTFNRIWHGETITPAQYLAVMGNKAVDAFALHAASVQLLLQAGVTITPDQYTPPLTYTMHQDGTITLD